VALDAGWACGKEVDDDVALDAAGMRQAVAWELAVRNVRRLEAGEAEALLRRETACVGVRDVKARAPAAAPPRRRAARCARSAWGCLPFRSQNRVRCGSKPHPNSRRPGRRASAGRRPTLCNQALGAEPLQHRASSAPGAVGRGGALRLPARRQVRLKSLKRRARLMYLPAYVADYAFGEQARRGRALPYPYPRGPAGPWIGLPRWCGARRGWRCCCPGRAPLPEARPAGRRCTRGACAQINVHNERKPQRFQAVVSGMDTASVAAERHFSPRKARALPHARAHDHGKRA